MVKYTWKKCRGRKYSISKFYGENYVMAKIMQVIMAASKYSTTGASSHIQWYYKALICSCLQNTALQQVHTSASIHTEV
jgi:hypothetical protein